MAELKLKLLGAKGQPQWGELVQEDLHLVFLETDGRICAIATQAELQLTYPREPGLPPC